MDSFHTFAPLICSICQDALVDMAADRDNVATPCGHVFHKPCLTHWFEKSRPVPEAISQIQREELFKGPCPVCSTPTWFRRCIKVYLSADREEVNVLQNQVDSLNITLRKKEKQLIAANSLIKLQTDKISKLEKARGPAKIVAVRDSVEMARSRAQTARNLEKVKAADAAVKPRVTATTRSRLPIPGTSSPKRGRTTATAGVKATVGVRTTAGARATAGTAPAPVMAVRRSPRLHARDFFNDTIPETPRTRDQSRNVTVTRGGAASSRSLASIRNAAASTACTAPNRTR